jgi:4-hydroxybenzoyl-CoA thioesterase/acyl-CoA thioester hydrolase
MITTETSAATSRASALERNDLSASQWSHTTRFHHGQCDPAGIVYTPEFFNVCNQAIEEWFVEELGLDYYDIIGRQKIGLGYATASATFFLPCRMGETVDIFVQVDRVGGRSYSLTLHGFRGDQEAFRGQFTTVVTSLEHHESIDIPGPLRSALVAYSDRTGS